MNRSALSLAFVLLSACGFAQSPHCQDLARDASFQLPSSFQENQGSEIGMHQVVKLFERGGIIYYGMQPKTAHPSGWWVLGVYRDESLREAESAALSVRLANPHLPPSYTENLKYFRALVVEGNDPYSAKAVQWGHCMENAKRADECTPPSDTLQIRDVTFYQPNECATETIWPVLMDDSSYSFGRSTAPEAIRHQLPYEKDILAAAAMLMGKPAQDQQASRVVRQMP